MIILVPVSSDHRALRIDPLHYGTLVVAALASVSSSSVRRGLLHRLRARRTSVEGAARAYVPYVLVLLAGLLLVAFVPWITLIVPRLMNL